MELNQSKKNIPDGPVVRRIGWVAAVRSMRAVVAAVRWMTARRAAVAGVSGLIIIFFSGCEKNDSSKTFGVARVYMPQATVSGGSNANYPVPTGNDSATWNFSIDSVNGKVNVLLGVSRSGTQAYNAFSVTVSTNTDTVNTLIQNGTLGTGAVLMPSNLYTLPSSVAVPAGSASASFNLTLDETLLKSYAGSKLVLAVSISNPTLYELYPQQSTTIVIINVSALPLP